MSEREEKFENMLAAVQKSYNDTTVKMETLKAQHKEKTATYRQLMGDKMTCQYILNLYKVYGLID